MKNFKPKITRIKLNPEQAVLSCDCYDQGTKARAFSGSLNSYMYGVSCNNRPEPEILIRVCSGNKIQGPLKTNLYWCGPGFARGNWGAVSSNVTS
jgi:hypothetical protein